MSEKNLYSTYNLSFRDYLNQVFMTMGLGLLISALSSLICNKLFAILPPQIIPTIFLAAIVIELIVALVFSTKLMDMSKTTAWFCYIFYSVLTGVTLSFVLEIYTASSAFMAFVSTIILFVCMAIIGHTTKADLSKFGPLLSVGLISIIISSLVNAFIFHSQAFDMIICYVGIIVFLGLIAYDVRKLRDLYNHGLNDDILAEKLMVYGAFQLYLDFINLFLRLLQVFGKRRD